MIRSLLAALLTAALACALPARAGTPAHHPAPTLPNVSQWAGHGHRLGAAAWAHALKLHIPYEISPAPNRPAPVKTDVLIAYTQTALWVRFIAHDPHPRAVRVHYRRHDDTSSNGDDYVGFMISPFNDTQWAYEFFCSAGGTETDAFRQGNMEYGSFDAIWGCRAHRTEYGYEVTIRLPFRSLKLPSTDKPQAWRLLFFRNWPRKFRYQLSGIRIDTNSNCLLCQARTLHTATPIKASHGNLQIIPAATVSRIDQRPTPSAPGLVKGAPKVSGGLDARWQIRPDLEWSATLNPNFSEVAPDVLQLSVNRRFAIFYPENRPFFRQGTWVFNTPLDLVDTRQVADPHWATKLTGQIGANALGALIANDAITNVVLPGPQQSNLHSFNFGTHDGLLRYRRDLSGNSEIGFLATARQGSGYSNDVFAVDGNWQIDPSDSVKFQAASSDTHYPSSVASALGTSAGHTAGNAWQIELDRERTHYSANLLLARLNNGFRADFGFVPQVGYLEAMPQFTYVWHGSKNAWYQSGGIGTFLDWYRETGGGPILNLRTQIYAFANMLDQTNAQISAQHEDIYVNGATFGLNQVLLSAGTQPTAWFYAGVNVTAGDGVDYQGTRRGGLLSIEPNVSLGVGSHLKIDLVSAFERLNVAGGRLYTASLYDVRASWHFTSRTFVRAIVQDQDIRRNTALYPSGTDSRTRTLATQWLFGYEVNPWTSLYAGYANGYLGMSDAGLAQQQRTFFIKASYDFQP